MITRVVDRSPRRRGQGIRSTGNTWKTPLWSCPFKYGVNKRMDELRDDQKELRKKVDDLRDEVKGLPLKIMELLRQPVTPER